MNRIRYGGSLSPSPGTVRKTPQVTFYNHNGQVGNVIEFSKYKKSSQRALKHNKQQ